MTPWRIHYEDQVIDGVTPEEWQAAPDTGVQVVVLKRDPIHPGPEGVGSERRWAHVTDRVLFTGIDEYDPLGYGVKYGTLLDDASYYAIWEDAKSRPLT